MREERKSAPRRTRRFSHVSVRRSSVPRYSSYLYSHECTCSPTVAPLDLLDSRGRQLGRDAPHRLASRSHQSPHVAIARADGNRVAGVEDE